LLDGAVGRLEVAQWSYVLYEAQAVTVLAPSRSHWDRKQVVFEHRALVRVRSEVVVHLTERELESLAATAAFVVVWDHEMGFSTTGPD